MGLQSDIKDDTCGSFHNDVVWNIYIRKNNNSLHHEIKISFEKIEPALPSISSQLKIHFPGNQAISDVSTSCNGTSKAQYQNWISKSSGEKIYVCNLDEILKSNNIKIDANSGFLKFPSSTVKKIEIIITLNEENGIDDLGPLFVANFSEKYRTIDLNPTNVIVNVHFPVMPLLIYIKRVLFSNLKQIGRIYEIFEFKGGDHWVCNAGYRKQFLRYTNRNNSTVFPVIGFAYKPTGKKNLIPMFSLGIKIMALFCSFLIGYMGSLLANITSNDQIELLFKICKSLVTFLSGGII